MWSAQDVAILISVITLVVGSGAIGRNLWRGQRAQLLDELDDKYVREKAYRETMDRKRASIEQARAIAELALKNAELAQQGVDRIERAHSALDERISREIAIPLTNVQRSMQTHGEQLAAILAILDRRHEPRDK